MHFLIKKPAIWFFPFLFVILFVLSIIKYPYLESTLSEQIALYGILAIFIFSFLLEFIPQFISPHSIIIIAYFFNYNLIISTLIVMIGSLLGTTMGFAVGRFYGEDFMKDFISPKNFEKIRDYFNKFGRYYIALSAVSPLPFIPIVFGAIGVSKRNFLYYGIFPRIASFIILAVFFYFIL